MLQFILPLLLIYLLCHHAFSCPPSSHTCHSFNTYACVCACVRVCVCNTWSPRPLQTWDVLQPSHVSSLPSTSLVTCLSAFIPTISFSENATLVSFGFLSHSTCTMTNYCVNSISRKDHRPEEADRSTGRMGDGKGAWPQPVVT